MPIKVLIACIILATLVFLSSCTEQGKARAWGGSFEVRLPAGNKLVTATWKQTDLFYLYQPMDSNDVPKTSIFQESSNFGVYESKVIFIETR